MRILLKGIVVCLLTLISVFPAAEAEDYLGRTISSYYDEYYNGDYNYPFISGRQGAGYYMDKSSLVITHIDQEGFEFAYNFIGVDFLYGGNISSYGTAYNRWNANDPEGIYVKWNNASNWIRYEESDYSYKNYGLIGYLIGLKVIQEKNLLKQK